MFVTPAPTVTHKASCGFSALKKTFVKDANSSPRTEYFLEFFDGFLQYVQENKCPLDFFSWHIYKNDPKLIGNKAALVRTLLDKYGFRETESILNEWNYVRGWTGDDWLYSLKAEKSLKGASFIAGTMCECQRGTVDLLMYYDGSIESTYGGLFNPLTRTPFKAYYTFYGFGQLYGLGYQYPIEDADPSGRLTDTVYALAAGNADASKRAVLLFNLGGETQVTVPEGEWTLLLLDDAHDLTPVGSVRGGESFGLPAESGAMLIS